MRSTPLIVTTTILVKQHSEMNTGLSVAPVTQLAQPLALFRWAVLSLNGHAAKHNGAANDDRSRNKRRLDVHVRLRCQAKFG